MFSKRFILTYLVVFYCVIVDENEEVKHQRSQTEKKNEEKVPFYLNIKVLKLASSEDVNR